MLIAELAPWRQENHKLRVTDITYPRSQHGVVASTVTVRDSYDNASAETGMAPTKMS